MPDGLPIRPTVGERGHDDGRRDRDTGIDEILRPRCVVNALDLRIPQGSVYGFLGRNGAGKSTTIKMLLGLVQADAGQAELLGEEATQVRPDTRARIAYLAEGHPLYRWMTIGEMVRFTRAFYYPRWDERFIEQILDHFDLSHRRKIRHLSRGQRAQVALALAVAPDPELLILDDPTLGLDTVVRRDFLESMIRIIQRRGRTILFSSHILADVERVADRIGILVDGVLRVDCPTDTFKSRRSEGRAGFRSRAAGVPGLPGRGEQLPSGYAVGVGGGAVQRGAPAADRRLGAAVAGSAGLEPGGCLHRIHARAAPPAAGLCGRRKPCGQRWCVRNCGRSSCSPRLR